jgi:ketosteroid isomerase-like protein
VLFRFGADGLLTRAEQFDPDRDAEALARFDQLTRVPGDTERAPRRRIRANAATANAARLDAVLAARDVDGLLAVFADDAELTDHRVAATYDRQGALRTWRSFIRMQGAYRHEPLASLGEALALCRQWTSGSEASTPTFDVGAREAETLILIEVDAHGRRRRSEIFAADRLLDAVGRLYARYAELLPKGPERAGAAAVAQITPLIALVDPDVALATTIAADAELADHRMLGFPTLRGPEAIRGYIRSLLEAAADLAFRFDDVLGPTAIGWLVRLTNVGTDRAGGGRFERRFIWLSSFGPGGSVRRWEFFDADRDAEALARFEAVVSDPPAHRVSRRVHLNAATESEALIAAAVAARDLDAIAAHIADDCEIVVVDQLENLRPRWIGGDVSRPDQVPGPDLPHPAAGQLGRLAGAVPPVGVGERGRGQDVRHRRLRHGADRAGRGRRTGPALAHRAVRSRAAGRRRRPAVRTLRRASPRWRGTRRRRGDGGLGRGPGRSPRLRSHRRGVCAGHRARRPSNARVCERARRHRHPGRSAHALRCGRGRRQPG